MHNTAILITGCQRSGTTLLSLVLDSHPEVTGIDEMQFQTTKIPEYLNSPDFHPFVAWKLPGVAHNIREIKAIPRIRVLWCIRDPRDVVVSMCKLRLNTPPLPVVSWAVHSYGALREINNCYPVLDKETIQCLKPELSRYQQIAQKLSSAISRAEAIFTASLCWRLKNELPVLYRNQNIDYMIVSYDKLVQDPEREIRGILEFCGLDWHENVLQHHQLHIGTSVGKTDNARAIDSDSRNRWIHVLTEDELSTVIELCKASARKYGYLIG